jgi:hypothetical protein
MSHLKNLSFSFFISLLCLQGLAQENIADARNNFNLGDVVTVTGIVTNDEALGSIRYIQDESGGIAIYPGFNWNSLPFTPQIGDNITVTGELTEFASLLEVGPSISSLVLNSSNNPLPQPFDLSPDEWEETYEGILTRVENAVFSDGGAIFSSSTYNFTANGEIGVIYVRSGSPLIGELIPVGEVDITGILSQFSFNDPDVGYQLLPRTMDDFFSENAVNFASGVSQTNLSTTGFTLSWTTDVGSTTEIEYGTTPDYGQSLTLDENVVDHVINLEGLDPGTPYFCRVYSVIAEDTASATGTFSTVSLSSGEIEVYFNRSVDNSFSTGVDAISLFNATDDTIISHIDDAMYTIDMAAYNINSGTIVQALNNALDRGVTIRYIAEGQNANLALVNLDPSIPVLERENASSSGMHNKFIVIDRENVDSAVVITGSTNFTSNNLFDDPNNLLIVQDQALARAFTIEFEEMWGSTGPLPDPILSRFGELKTNNTPQKFIIGGKNVELYFSPSDNTTNAITEAISTADFDLEFALLLITNNQLSEAIVEEANIFLQPRGIVEDENISGSDYEFLLDEGIDIHVHSGFGQLHHKYAIIDHSEPNSDPIVVTGSHNWSASAESVNDENTLIIHDATIANLFYQEFMARYNEATLNTEERNAIEFKLFPNPAIDEAHLVYSSPNEPVELRVFSLTGQQLIQQMLPASGQGMVTLQLSELSAGIYLLRLDNGKTISTTRLIKGQ